MCGYLTKIERMGDEANIMWHEYASSSNESSIERDILVRVNHRAEIACCELISDAYIRASQDIGITFLNACVDEVK